MSRLISRIYRVHIIVFWRRAVIVLGPIGMRVEAMFRVEHLPIGVPRVPDQ